MILPSRRTNNLAEINEIDILGQMQNRTTKILSRFRISEEYIDPDANLEFLRFDRLTIFIIYEFSEFTSDLI